MSRIESIILEYCNEEKPKYALLIDGKWGEGKTYFLKNKIANEISNSKYFIYISLNGIEDTARINELILNNLFFNTTKKGSVFSAIVTTGLDILKKKIGLNDTNTIKRLVLPNVFDFTKTVVCFDDLERISPKLKTEDVLGFINTNFVEHNNISTIIVCDKIKITESEGKDNFKGFDIIKEKVIGRTLKFEYEINQVVELFRNEIIDSGEKEKQFYEKHEELFNEFFKKTNIKNLRTVFFISDNLKRIIPFIDDKIESETLTRCINFILIVSTEFKRGEFPRPKEFYQDFYEVPTFLLEDIGLKEQTYTPSLKQDTTEVPPKDDFKKVYSEIGFSFLESVYDFIINGYFNPENIVKDLDALNNDILSKREKQEYVYVKNLRNFNFISGQEFDETFDNVISNLEKGKYGLDTFISDIKNYLVHFFKIELLEQFKDINELDVYLADLISKMDAGSDVNQNSLLFINRNSWFYKPEPDLPLTEVQIKIKIEEIRKIYNEKNNSEILEVLKKDIKLFIKDRKEPFLFILQNMTPSEISEYATNLLKTDLSSFHFFRDTIEYAFDSLGMENEFNNCKERLNNLIPILEEKSSDIDDKIQKRLLKDLIGILKKKGEKLEKIIV